MFSGLARRQRKEAVSAKLTAMCVKGKLFVFDVPALITVWFNVEKQTFNLYYRVNNLRVCLRSCAEQCVSY